MRYLLKRMQVILFCLLIFSSCSSDKPISEAKVSIKKENGKFTLYRNGEPFYIKGAAGDTHLDKLRKAGGNAIRIWDTTNVDSILKKANENGIAVIIGLPIPESHAMHHYNDPAKVAKQFNDIKNLVNKHKNDPAVLMWCVGNELVFPFKPSYHNFYKAFNNIVDMIHEDDPDHPVTTTMVNFQPKEIFNMKVRTDVDLISFNIFGKIHSFNRDLKSFAWFWNGAYLITEWGIDGPWEGTAQTAWSAYIEPSSTQKAATILFRHKKQMPLNDPRFVGSFIFYWGQKQETTHTWYSLFDDQGNQTEAVDLARTAWTGKASLYKGPKIKTMHLEGKEAKDDILLKATATVSAEVLIETNESVEQAGFQSNVQSIKWEIYPEDWFKKDKLNNLKRPNPLEGLILESTGLKVSFIVPEKEGPYRLFATIYDVNGYIATSNTPFYVLAAQ
ncbi:glycoside hydrolase family 2 TIM barrel-domain containing protein [Pedobacter immunditicola]|uniref:glycoside hydrolase family 2 TIM barrel-domain containing protein n=1 Tax=Pedobacter immunditicola TaxID=3133440 RepID=UPI0030A003AD